MLCALLGALKEGGVSLEVEVAHRVHPRRGGKRRVQSPESGTGEARSRPLVPPRRG